MNIEPSRVVGQTMCELLLQTAHAELEPAIRTALSGERQRLERTGCGDARGFPCTHSGPPDCDSEESPWLLLAYDVILDFWRQAMSALGVPSSRCKSFWPEM